MINSNIITQVPKDWAQALESEMQAPYLQSLSDFVDKEYRSDTAIYPPKELIFHALEQTPFSKVRVVVVGQDPYHGPGQAHGLCFSVPEGIRPPPSLVNIFKELKSDLGIQAPNHGSLSSWASQGVLLLNATLTVKESAPLSHHGKGWELFTDAIIRRLWKREEPLVFLLWGNSAQQKFSHCVQPDSSPHLILMAAHPSPFSAYRGFFGCRHFSKTNQFLMKHRLEPIDWTL